ncbi:MAG: hypothetical protein ACPGWR_12350 [Ardenticatenaceae bacterium]
MTSCRVSRLKWQARAAVGGLVGEGVGWWVGGLVGYAQRLAGYAQRLAG